MNPPSLHEYQVVGRKNPSAVDPHPKLLRMRIFAPNKVVAKSRFWYFVGKLQKLKRANGEVINCTEIHETRPNLVKNYAVLLRYTSRSGEHNFYKEFRDTTRAGAVQQLYIDMAGRHRARWSTIQILEVATIPAKLVRRKQTETFLNPKISFPIPHRRWRPRRPGAPRFLRKAPSTFSG